MKSIVRFMFVLVGMTLFTHVSYSQANTINARVSQAIAEKGEIARELREHVWPLVESRAVKVLVDRVFPLADAAGAHRHMETSAHIGKIILSV